MTVHPLLPYLPLALQRRLALGLTIPVALAAVRPCARSTDDGWPWGWDWSRWRDSARR